MKKIITVLLLSFFLPFQILAYSENIIAGGENIGITINSEGLVVVGFYKVDGKYIASKTLNVGDVILKIEDTDISSINEMSRVIDENINDGKVNITIKRNNKIMNTKLELVKSENIYKTGLYVKEKINGIGTLTYIDPITKIYGALGHEIIINETDLRVEVKSGNIYSSYVNSIDRSANGTVGSKNATILYSTELGTIIKNTTSGIFGKYESKLPDKDLVPVAKVEDIKLGSANIYTIVNSQEIKTFNINITGIDKKNLNTSKAISFEINDPELLESTGGIVQGMSGSPIIQDGKIIGAVTHVVIEDVKKGYAIFIRTMLEEGER